jgi:nucleoside-diphosphate-sugar epimerase
VTGGAGYVGAVLVPRLLREGYRVRVLDLYLYGERVLECVSDHPDLSQIKGDLRDQDLLRLVLPGCDAVIHLACISNDPSFELDPALARSINYDAFEPLVRIAGDSGVRRFIYASSSSVYGIKAEPNVHEEVPLEPLTDYSRYKAMCEDALRRYQTPEFTTVTVRPATVCGCSPRQRLDVIVNILTNHAVNTGTIKVFGGDQKRPNIHIDDMVDLYALLLRLPPGRIAGKVYNAGGANHTVRELAEIVRRVVGPDRVRMETVATDDPRSYHISSEKIAREFGWRARRTVEQAARELAEGLTDGRLTDPMNNPLYYNIRRMRELQLR